jgi:hypothetical protein
MSSANTFQVLSRMKGQFEDLFNKGKRPQITDEKNSSKLHVNLELSVVARQIP